MMLYSLHVARLSLSLCPYKQDDCIDKMDFVSKGISPSVKYGHDLTEM